MAEQPKEFYEKKPGFTVKSGVPDGAGRTIDYSMFTDNSQGFHYTTDGMKFDICNSTCYELSGEDCQEGEPARVIRTINGDIIIDAMDGDIILRGRNIRIVAYDGEGEVTINAAKQIATNAPKQTFKGTNIDTVATATAAIGGNFVETAAGISASGGVITDITQGSFLGQIMKVLQKFKKWLECGE